MNTPTTPLPIVVFDFDGTLIQGDCVARWLRWQLRGSIWRQIFASIYAPFGVLLLRFDATRFFAVSGFLYLATFGIKDHAHLRQVYLNYFASIENIDELRIMPVLEALHAHLAAGDRVVIATGAEKMLAQTLWQSIGGPKVEWVASSIRPFAGAWVSSRHTIGERKLSALIGDGFTPPYSAMYSDSEQDLPVMRHACEVILVARTQFEMSRLNSEVVAQGLDTAIIKNIVYRVIR